MLQRFGDLTVATDIDLDLPRSDEAPQLHVACADLPAHPPHATLIDRDDTSRTWRRDGSLTIAFTGGPVIGIDDVGGVLRYRAGRAPRPMLSHTLANLGLPYIATTHAQRRFLHATAVERDGSTIAFTGPSMSGKSTLAASLVDRGWALVADDALMFDAHEAAVVHPTARHLRLRLDRHVRRRVALAIGPTRLRAVVLVGRSTGALTLSATGLAEAHRRLAGQLMSPLPAGEVGVDRFVAVNELFGSVDVLALDVPQGIGHVDAAVDVLLGHLA
jgi:hypothetical protein